MIRGSRPTEAAHPSRRRRPGRHKRGVPLTGSERAQPAAAPVLDQPAVLRHHPARPEPRSRRRSWQLEVETCAARPRPVASFVATARSATSRWAEAAADHRARGQDVAAIDDEASCSSSSSAPPSPSGRSQRRQTWRMAGRGRRPPRSARSSAPRRRPGGRKQRKVPDSSPGCPRVRAQGVAVPIERPSQATSIRSLAQPSRGSTAAERSPGPPAATASAAPACAGTGVSRTFWRPADST